MLKTMTTLKEYKDLKKEILKHNKLYYQENAPVISDQEYDELFLELKKIEKENPAWIRSDSPTQKPGDDKSGKFPKYKHQVPMLSIKNTYSNEDLLSFWKKINNQLGDEQNWIVSQKLDGAAISVIYRNDVLVVGATRGDGEEGDDITENIKVIEGLPHFVSFSSFGIEEIELRGEVIMLFDDLKKINIQRELEGKDLYANARNLASGSLKLLDPKEVAKRNLKIKFHSIGFIKHKNESMNSYHGIMEICKSYGLPINDYIVAKDINFILFTIEKFRRFTLPYPTDGMVVSIDNLENRKKIGSSSHSPKWVIAYKYPAEQVETVLRDIVYQVGRTGIITPKAKFDPVSLAGTTVVQATLHNEDFIVEKGLQIGDVIVVEKGGEIIPKVVKVSKKGEGKKFKFTDRCPECKSFLIRKEGESAWKCVNSSCPAQLIRRIEHFVSKRCMDIDGFGKERVLQFVEAGLIKDIPDIYRLNESMILQLDRTGKRMAEKLLSAIEKSKNCDPSDLLSGLGIPLVGKSASPLLLEMVDTIPKVFDLTQEQVESIEGLGSSIYEALQVSKEWALQILEDLALLGLNMEVVKMTKQIDSNISGKTFVITGSFENYVRSDVEKLIKDLGGKISGSVSAKTDYLICGEGTQGKSKHKKALELGTPIVGEEFLESLS